MQFLIARILANFGVHYFVLNFKVLHNVTKKAIKISAGLVSSPIILSFHKS